MDRRREERRGWKTEDKVFIYFSQNEIAFNGN